MQYSALVSSDWNQCLASCGPFDVFTYHYPEHRPVIERVFRQYTGNAITLSQVVGQLEALLPKPISRKQMDAYLQNAFATYSGVTDLIQGCLDRGILFMINTTGMVGYFQRAWALKLLPPLAMLAANPMVRFADSSSDWPEHIYEINEITDKAEHTATVADRYGIPFDKIVIVGDSGGDGPHFEWGASVGAYLIGSMTKPSLKRFCDQRGIAIDHLFGRTYAEGEQMRLFQETAVDFRDLLKVILQMVGLTRLAHKQF